MPTPDHAIVSHPDEPALLRIEGPIATITLNRPAAFNSIDLSIAKKLEQLGAQIEASDDIRVLVLEGAGRAFCAGGDLQTIGAAAAADTIAPVVGKLLKHYHAFITSLRRMPKIVLASVHGSAAGAGLSLAFVADLCIAAEDARFTPAYAKLGVSPDGGGTVGVVASVGPRRALQIYLAEDSFSTAQAYGWGLVAKVVPAAELKVATRELAQRLAQNAPAALAATKALVDRARSSPPLTTADSRKEIGRQLGVWQAGLYQALGEQGFRTSGFGPYVAPESNAPWFTCWARTNADVLPKPRALASTTNCSMQTSLFIAGDLQTGQVDLAHSYVRSIDLNAFQFSTFLSRQYQPSWFGTGARSPKRLTAQQCHEDFIEAAADGAHPMLRAVWCARAYREFDGLYDVSLVAVTQDRSDEALVSRLNMQSVTFENAMALATRFLETLQWKK